jgi:hypothetical protein
MTHEPQTFVDLQDAGNAQSQLILQAVARHANWDTGACFPNVRTLARMAKCSDKTVRRHLARLAVDGIIAVERDRYGRNGAQTSNVIRLIGYAQWIAANRNGGTVARPRHARRYDDRALGHNDGPTPGQPDQGGPVDNVGDMTKAPGRIVTRPPGQQVTSHESSSNNLLNRSARVRARSLKHDSDDGRHRRPARIERYVSEAALDRVRDIAPGWDRQALLKKFLNWPGSGNARDLDAAFLGWARKFTRGQDPYRNPIDGGVAV